MRLLPVFMLLGLPAQKVWALQLVWTNTAGGNWTNAANWDLGTVPTLADSAIITNAGTYTITVNSAASAASVVMGLADTNFTGIRTLNLTAGSLTLTNAAIETNGVLNFSNGALTVRGLATAKGDFTWTAGTINGGGELQVGSANGVATISGAGAKTLTGVTLGNFSSAGAWSGASWTVNAGATFYNSGLLTMTNDQTFAYSSGAAVGFDNYGTVTKSGGAGQFLLSSVRFRNNGTLNINSGSLALTAITATNTGSLNLGAASQLLFNSGTFQLGGQVSAPTANSVQLIGGTAVIVTPSITSPAIWLAGATVQQQTNISVAVINESAGVLQLEVPCFLSQLNQTNGEVRGRSLTVTNWNWFAGDHNRSYPGGGVADDRTIIPAGGVMNLLGTATRYFSFYTPTGPGRTLDNFGTINWSGNALLYSYGSVNNYGSVIVSAVGVPQFVWNSSYTPAIWNNYGTFTRTAGTVFYFDRSFVNNFGTFDIQQGVLSTYNNTFTNTGVINLGASGIFQSEVSSVVVLGAAGSIVAPTADSIRFGGASVSLETTNIVSPSIWQQAGTLFQRTNFNVAQMNMSAGVWQLEVPIFVNQFNQTNGELRGRSLTVTNWNWFAGDHNRSYPGGSVADDRTIIPAGGVMNLLGTTTRNFSYYTPTGPGRALDNFGTINWSGNALLYSYGSVNNYGAVNVSAVGAPEFVWNGANTPAIWNNYGTFTRSAGTVFYFERSFVNNFGTFDIQQGTLSIYNATLTNSSLINLAGGAIFQTEVSSVVVLDAASRLVAPTANSIRFGGTSVSMETTNIVSPTIWLQAGTLFQRTNITVATINESGGALQLEVPAFLSQLNETNGHVQGRTLTVTNWNWFAGVHYRNTPTGSTNDDRTIIPAGGVMNFLGTDGSRGLSYYIAGPGRTLDNFGTINWPGNAVLSSYGTVNNYGSVTVSAVGVPQYYSSAPSSVPSTWNNYGTFTRSAGTLFYFQGGFVNNSGLMDIQQGTLSIYNATFTNSTGWLNVGASGIFQSEITSVVAFNAPSRVTAPTGDSIRLASTTAVIETTNIVSPSIWLQAGTLYQRTNIVVAALNESGGALQLDVPATLNQLNQTNGHVQGRTLTVTNWNWFAGVHYRNTPAGSTNDDRTIIPAGGVMNFLGTDGSRGLSYFIAGPGRTLDNFGTINWPGNAVLSSYGTVNNYGAVTVSAIGAPQYYSSAPSSVPSTWNNYGTFTRSAGTLFYFQGGFVNNSGTMDIQQGTLSIYNATFTNSTGLLNVGASGIFLSELNSVVAFNAASRVTAITTDSIRFNSTTAVIETTNIVSPSIWLQAGTLYQRTNIVVATLNESGGALQLEVPAFLNQLNQTNGDVQGRTLTVTNWNWFAGQHYRGNTSSNTVDDRTIIPAGGVMNLLGTASRNLSYLVSPGPGRTLDNFGSVNWSGNAILGSYGQFNNYGSVNVSATGTPQYYSSAPSSVPSTWNNYGTFTRSSGTLFYFQGGFVNNPGLMDIQQGTLSIYNATFTNQSGGNLLAQLNGVIANDVSSVSFFEAGSSLGCVATNAFQINSGSVTLRTAAITAPSLWINGGILNQNTNNAVPVINESAGTWQLNVPISLATYNLTNGDLRGANLTLNNFNWLGGVLYAAGPGSNLVTVSSQLYIGSATAKTMSYLTAQPGRSLINNGAATWGGANVTGTGGSIFQNNGTLTLTNDVGFVFGGGNASVFNNAGTFTKSAGTGIASFSSTTITNSGTFNVNSGGFNVGGDFVETGGNAYLGTNFTASSNVRIQAGSLTGRGGITGSFYNNGMVNPGSSPGFINGNTFTNTAAAIYNVELGGNPGPGTNYDQLRFSGPVTLDGTLNVSLYNNYALILSNRFTVLTTSARTGTFANVIPPPGATLNTIYSSTNVVLEVIGLTNAPLQILTNPVSQTVWTPDPATFFAAVSGVTPLTFQWQFNSNNIPGATNTTYSIPAVAVTNNGLYTLQITDASGGTTNTSATLTVIPFANTIWWTNVLGGNWSAPANWTPNRIPNGTNNVVIVSNGTYTVTVDVPSALSNLTVGALGATGTPIVHLVNGQSLTINGNTSWETNSVLALNGLLQMRGGSNSVRGHLDWQLGTLSGAGRTVIATNATLTFYGSLNQKFISTNVLENYGTFTYGNDSFGNAQGLRFSGGAQLTNYPSGVISIGTAAYDYSGSQIPRSYFVNYGTINANSSIATSPTYLSIDFINYGTLQDNGYVYISRGTNYGTFQYYNTLCEVSVFGDETTGEYFSFEDGTTFVGAYPSLAVGGYAQWNTTAVHPGRLTVLSGSGGASFANPEFRVLKNYTQTGQTIVYKGRWTQANPAVTADLNNLTDGLVNNFHSFVITNAGTLNVNNLNHGIRNFANSGSILVRSNLTLAGSSYTYGGGTINIAANASATFSGGTVEAQTVLNHGTNFVTGGLAFIGNTFYRNYAGAQTYFGGGSFVTGPAGVLNEGLINGFGGMTISVTNRATVLADDYLNRNLALGNYVQESGLTWLNPGNASGNLNILGGLLKGAGTINGNVRNAANIVPGQPFGLLSVTGNFTNAASGTYFLPINGTVATTNFPQTSVSGTSVLAGTLYVNFTNGFNPAPGNLFTAMVFTARSGVFDAIVNDTYGLEAFYTPTSLVLRAENLLPNVTINVLGGSTQIVCQPFQINASASDPDGTVTNLILRLDGATIASSAGSSLTTTVESDFPMPLLFVAQATDDRGGIRSISQPVQLATYPVEVLTLGGFRTNSTFKICMAGLAGTNYFVEANTNLATTNWVNIGPMQYTNGIWRYFDMSTTNFLNHYYRAKRGP